MNEYNTVINENREIKYSKKFLELYQNNKIKKKKKEKKIQKMKKLKKIFF